MPEPIVAIVGRPNVGKSTLFNRLTGGRMAIVEENPGITRDRLYKTVEWNGRTFILVDTGGLDYQETDEMYGQVRQQVEIAISEADALLFIVDARLGLTVIDEEIAVNLRRAGTPVLLVANKVEKFDGAVNYYDFFKLGLGEPIPCSAAQGLNTGDLLDRLLEVLPVSKNEALPEDIVKVAVVGRPNVGKSSLVNSILGSERVIVSDVPGTTRDEIDTWYRKDGKNYLLVDTAGIRRKSLIKESVEKYSVIRALKSIERCDISLIMIDAQSGVTEQDKRIAGFVHERGKASILVVNKWDLIEKDEHTGELYRRKVQQELNFLDYAPIVLISALSKKRVHQLLGTIDSVWIEYNRRIGTGDLNSLLEDLQLRNPPPTRKSKKVTIYYATQGAVKPPTFVLFTNAPELMHFSYMRYLDNQLRQAHGFKGTPIRIILRKRSRKGEPN